MGAKRLVLARECSKEDIKRIKSATNLDLEAFIHGAMCTSISGDVFYLIMLLIEILIEVDVLKYVDGSLII